jgi:putative transposase
MTTAHSSCHTKWDCKYHIVWIPKYRKKKLIWELRQELGPVQTMCTYWSRFHRNMLCRRQWATSRVRVGSI